MSKEQLAMSNEKMATSESESGDRKQGKTCNKKTCLDCLHCKISRLSIVTERLCYCDRLLNKKEHPEPYWLEKKPCKKFDNMNKWNKEAE